MKIVILSVIIIFLFSLSVYGETIEEQIAKCEQSTYKDLCLASLGISEDTTSSTNTIDELIEDCIDKDYEDLCISAVAKSKNDQVICDYIQEPIKRESCLDNFSFQIDSEVREQAVKLQESVIEINEPTAVFNLEENKFGNTIIFVVIGVIIIAVFILILHHFHLNKHPKFKEKIVEGKDTDSEQLEIMNYIKGARHAGLTDKEIKDNLASVGWKEDKVEKSFGNL